MAGSLPYTGLRYKYRLIEENLDILPDYRVAEIGVGTGFSCFKIAQKAAYVCGIDIAEELIETLGEIAGRFTNVTFLKADVAIEDPPADLKSSMDVVISIDTLNHVPSTPGFLRYVAGLLKPGGVALICFPNEPDENMEGVVNFKNEQSLKEVIDQSGLECRSFRTAEYTQWFHFINDNLWYRPKRLFYRSHYNGETPQVFTDTVAFRMLKEKKGLNLLVRSYAALVMAILRIGGVYRYISTHDIYGKYIVLKLLKPS